jgi:hypothetical protein
MSKQDVQEVKIKLPQCALDFMDYLADMAGQTRDEYLMEAVRGSLACDLNNPHSLWNEDHLKERFGLKAYLDGDKEDGS